MGRTKNKALKKFEDVSFYEQHHNKYSILATSKSKRLAEPLFSYPNLYTTTQVIQAKNILVRYQEVDTEHADSWVCIFIRQLFFMIIEVSGWPYSRSRAGHALEWVTWTLEPPELARAWSNKIYRGLASGKLNLAHFCFGTLKYSKKPTNGSPVRLELNHQYLR